MSSAAAPLLPALPIDAVLPALLDALRQHGQAVLQAPPGAGKTTKVPLALLESGLSPGRILMLEPRRLAARMAAARMAETLGEKPGATVGFRIRGESCVSSDTKIEVVTEGILTRMIQSDPELSGIGTVIFDEFHERSLNADLGLAMTHEIRTALREDLILIVMSATLDAAPVADLLGGAPVITSEGRAFPVETRWLARPRPPRERLENTMADQICEALATDDGSLLAFLPGEGEIRRTAALLQNRLPADCTLAPLYGALGLSEQRLAIRPVRQGRKVVLATAVAETSLTIDGVRIVVDGGRARRARFDPGSGMSRLVTERVTKAEATQRRGRAGRLSPGICYRLWTRGEEGALAAFPPAEIQSTDLTGLVLELALWGSSDPAQSAFLTQPDPGAWQAAQQLLQNLGALDKAWRITAHGRQLAALPLHPRLAHMLVLCGPDAALLAALMADRDPLPRSAPSDLALRLDALSGRGQGPFPADPNTLRRIREEARRLSRLVRAARRAGGPDKAHADDRVFAAATPAEMAALAYPDRIALRRPGDEARFVMSGGKGAFLHDSDPLAGQRLLVATDLDGDRREARIRLAAPLSEAMVRRMFANEINAETLCSWSRRDGRVLARIQERLGALVLSDQAWKDAGTEALARAAIVGWQALRPPLAPGAERFAARVRLLSGVTDIPDFSPDALVQDAETWLLPWFLTAAAVPRSARDLRGFDVLEALRARLSHPAMTELDRLCPAHFTSPLGNRIPIDYGGETPAIELRIQEVYGTRRHPVVGTPPRPLRITLLSPARRPVQVTSDLPGFWKTTWADVRKDMRGRYPKHPWPEDPSEAPPTLRARPRKN